MYLKMVNALKKISRFVVDEMNDECPALLQVLSSVLVSSSWGVKSEKLESGAS